MKICCVTGHREIEKNQIEYVKKSLLYEIKSAVSDGYTGFMTGFASGADQYFAEAVIQLKKKYPDLKLIAAIPYRKRLFNLGKNEFTEHLLEACSDIKVISEEYFPNVYHIRNNYMVQNSERVIAVYDGRQKGGTFSTVRLANSAKKELRIIYLNSTDCIQTSLF